MRNRRRSRDSGPSYVIGLDVGTTAVKCLVAPVDGGDHSGGDHSGGDRRSLVTSRPTGTLSPRPGQHVQRAEDLLAACDGALAEGVSRLEVEDPGAQILAVGLSTAMHGLVALDAEGLPLTDIISWADSRADEHAARLRRLSLGTELHRATGTPVHAMSPLTKLMWWREHDPEFFAEVHTWTDIKGLLLAHLTGKAVIDRSCASGTGMLDLASGHWHEAALELTGVEVAQLPQIIEPEAALDLHPRAAARVGLPPDTPVVAGAADGPCGNLGTGAVLPGVAGMSLGTSGALRTVFTGPPPANLPPGLFCYALARDQWVIGGAISNGGSALEWLTTTILTTSALTPRAATDSEEESAPSRPQPAGGGLLSRAGDVAPGSDGLMILPYLTGERAPLWDPAIPGMVLGLRSHHRQEHLVRATYEGIALQLGAVLSQVTSLTDVDRVLVTGGAVRNRWQVQTLAAVFERPVELTRGLEGSAVGAAALALSGIGHADSPIQARDMLVPASTPGTIADPDEELVAIYRGARARLVELADQARVAARSLSG